MSYESLRNFKNWTENDFENYREFCKEILSKGGLMCRECWHLHCDPNECTIQKRLKEQYFALYKTKIFPKDICKMIILEILNQDIITPISNKKDIQMQIMISHL